MSHDGMENHRNTFKNSTSEKSERDAIRAIQKGALPSAELNFPSLRCEAMKGKVCGDGGGCGFVTHFTVGQFEFEFLSTYFNTI
jgi:hypothetical protein